jgi:hypothetical protein
MLQKLALMLQEGFFQAKIIIYLALFEFNPTSLPGLCSMAYISTPLQCCILRKT